MWRCACLGCCGSCPRSPGWGCGPKRVWVTPRSEGSARGWSKRRLSLAVLARSRRFRADSDAFWTRRPERPRIRPRLRRLLDHQADGRPGRWDTNSLFRKATVPPGSRGGWAADSAPYSACGDSAGLRMRVWQEDRAGWSPPARIPQRGASPGAPDPHTEKGPGLVGMDEAGALGASAPPTRSPERRSRRTPGRSRPASSPAPRGRDRWRRRRTAAPCRPCAAPGSPSSSPRPSCPG